MRDGRVLRLPPASPLLRLFLLALVLAAAGCDSTADDSETYTGTIEVALARADDRRAVRLVAVDDTGCNTPLIVETISTPTFLGVRVVGIARPTGATCLAIIPASATVALPFEDTGNFPVEIMHAGSTDAYLYSLGFIESFLPVRTRTTRLAAP